MMLLTISIACFNKVELTIQCLNSLKSNSSSLDKIQFILIDNGSEDGTLKEITSFPLPNKIIIHNKYNVGFGSAHNIALKSAIGRYFLVLNNDLFIHEKGWDSKLVGVFERSRNIVIGLKGVHCTIRPDGTGYIGTQVDYIEGSFLAGRTSDFKTYGLFSPEMKMFLAEDSDLSFRYKQMGFLLKQIDLKYKHVEHATLNTVDNAYRSRIFEANRKIFHSRWSKCFSLSQLSNKILVYLSSVGIGDVLCSTPTLKALRKDHPTAKIDIETRFPDVFKNHPEVNRVFKFGSIDHGPYDRVIELNPDYSRDTPMYKEFERIASVTLESKLPEIYLDSKEVEFGKQILGSLGSKYKRFIVCSLLMKRVEWQGRNWSIENKREFIALLKQSKPSDCAIIEVGKEIPSTDLSDLNLVNKTSLREMFSVINQSHVFVGIDSLPFHVAQAFKKKSVILFGATRPNSRVIDHSTVTSLTNDNLECLGCYHDKREKGFNVCDRRDQACMIGIEPKDVVKKVMELL